MSMHASSVLALFAAMAALACLPSTSTLVVVVKSTSLGFRHGALTAVGIVLGDLIYVLVAVFGLVLLVASLGAAVFVWVQYAGGLYLLWLSMLIWRSRKLSIQRPISARRSSLFSSFMTGLLITLGDQKAILFYLGFLPTFMDLSALTTIDVIVVANIVIVAVGGVKLTYAYGADKIRRTFTHGLHHVTTATAAVVMFVAGLWVIVQA